MSILSQDGGTSVEPSLPEAPTIHPGPRIGLDPQPDMLQSKRVHGKAQLPRNTPGHRWGWIITGSIFLLLTIASGYTLAVYVAYSSLAARLQDSGPLGYAGAFNFSGKDFLAPYNSNIIFSGSYNPKSKSNSLPQLNGKFDGHMAGSDYLGAYAAVDGVAYTSLTGKVMPVLRYRQSPILYPLVYGQQYSAKLNNDLLGFVCENTSLPKQPQAARLYGLLRSTRPNNSWANPLARHNGKAVTHFKGTVDSGNFEQISQSLESLLPAGCNLGTFGFTPKDAARMGLLYQVWASKDQDAFELVLADSNLGARLVLNLVLTYSSQPEIIVAPKQSVDLNAAIKELEKHYQNNVLSGYN